VRHLVDKVGDVNDTLCCSVYVVDGHRCLIQLHSSLDSAIIVGATGNLYHHRVMMPVEAAERRCRHPEGINQGIVTHRIRAGKVARRSHRRTRATSLPLLRCVREVLPSPRRPCRRPTERPRSSSGSRSCRAMGVAKALHPPRFDCLPAAGYLLSRTPGCQTNGMAVGAELPFSDDFAELTLCECGRQSSY
jgi:hypothetical protein